MSGGALEIEGAGDLSFTSARPLCIFVGNEEICIEPTRGCRFRNSFAHRGLYLGDWVCRQGGIFRKRASGHRGQLRALPRRRTSSEYAGV